MATWQETVPGLRFDARPVAQPVMSPGKPATPRHTFDDVAPGAGEQQHKDTVDAFKAESSQGSGGSRGGQLR